MKYMIDISHHNSVLDWEDFKQHCDALMIRIGHGTSGEDRKWYYHIQSAMEYGIPFGVYLYSEAYDLEDFKKECQRLLKIPNTILGGIPICMDQEVQRGAIFTPWLEYFSSLKYPKKIWYTGDNFYRCNYASAAMKLLENNADLWIARYNNRTESPKTFCSIWQYTSTYQIWGKNFDRSIMSDAVFDRLFGREDS